MAAGFITAFIFFKKKYIFYTKNLMLLIIFLGIFFYDTTIGRWAGVHLYYFAFFFATVNVFSWQIEKQALIFYLILPIVLFAYTVLANIPDYNNVPTDKNLSNAIYLFNFCMTLVILGINGFIIIKENITAQKKLSLSKLNLQSLIDNTRGYIWSINTNYKLIAFNTSFKDIIHSHYKTECYEGIDVRTFFLFPNNPKELLGIYERALKGESFTEEYFSNNNYFEVQASPLYNTEKKIRGATFHSRIISAKKIGEQNLQQSKINLETLINSIGNSTWSITEDYKIIAASKLYISDMKKIFDIEICAGFDISTLFSLPNYPIEWKEQYNTVLSGKNLFVDYTFEDEFFELNAVPIKNIHNEIAGAVFFSRNITYRKNIEFELNKSRIKAEEAALAKAQFLSNMSHELRTPLNGIIGITNILLSEKYLPAQTNNLEILKHTGDHMLVLINDILDFNKIDAGKVELENNPFNLIETVEKMKSFFSWEASSKGLHLEININKELNRQVKGDVTRLRQVLTNLLSNAIKFTETGSIVFEIQILEKLSDKECLIRFSITDSGIGIEKDKLDHIFESFGQADASIIRKYGGSGLGLTISKKLIQLMNSELNVESSVGIGSKFWFDLVVGCSLENSLLPVEKKLNEIGTLESVHILAVEDNATNMLVVCKMLEKWNAKVSRAKDGSEAVELVEKNNNFHLILMDLQMPVMDGFTATKHIREKNKIVPIIALTATTDEVLTNILTQKGMNDVVQKPFIPEQLFYKIKQVLAV